MTKDLLDETTVVAYLTNRGIISGPAVVEELCSKEARAKELAASGDLRLACHLADFAGWAAPDDPDIHASRSEIYEVRRKNEASLMAKGIFKGASRESDSVVKKATGQ